MIRQYCIQIGYTMPDEDTLKITPYMGKFGVISEGGAEKIFIYLKHTSNKILTALCHIE